MFNILDMLDMDQDLIPMSLKDQLKKGNLWSITAKEIMLWPLLL